MTLAELAAVRRVQIDAFNAAIGEPKPDFARTERKMMRGGIASQQDALAALDTILDGPNCGFKCVIDDQQRLQR